MPRPRFIGKSLRAGWAPSGTKARRGRILPFLGLALLAHNFLFFVAAVWYVVSPPQKPDFLASDAEPIDISVVDLGSDEARALAADMQREQQKSADEQAKKEEEDTKARGQVVDVPRPVEERRPARSDYVSEYDTTVDKQTRARAVGKANPGQKPVAVAPTPRPPAPPAQPGGQPRPPGPPAPSPGRATPPGPLAMRAPQAEPPGKSAGPEVPAPDSERQPDGEEREDPDGALAHRGGPR
jgi:hypothetical protein